MSEKWITVKGKHMLVDVLKSGTKSSGKSKGSKNSKKTTPTAKIDELNKTKKKS